jgi:hypothetical protein
VNLHDEMIMIYYLKWSQLELAARLRSQNIKRSLLDCHPLSDFATLLV